MLGKDVTSHAAVVGQSDSRPRSQLIDWFGEGQSLDVEFAGTVVSQTTLGWSAVGSARMFIEPVEPSMVI